MKITKAQFKKIIKEEIGSVLESDKIEYSEPDRALMLNKAVLIRGYGYLTIGQIRTRIANSEKDLAKVRAELEEEELGLARKGTKDTEMLVRSIESKKTHLETQEQVMAAFKDTLAREDSAPEENR